MRSTFAQLAAIEWDLTSVAAGNHWDSRTLAGEIRGYNEFYQRGHAAVQRKVEAWLTRYSAAHNYLKES
ncbi:hypothetical protein [Streptomyces aureocirculatus]|uniref:hypothetical protein n=1 Tax=Streptomyces aureocirculatus TaxID=67275 RepID=UPI0004C6E00C|nr:hypothetical protein [Streptomyces aureocirculatus]